MSKFREGCPLALSYGCLVNYTKDVDNAGKPFVTLYFLVNQLLQSIGIYISLDDVLAKHKDTLPDDKPYNIKIKVPSDSIDLAKSLTLGESYWIEYATGMQNISIDSQSVTYQGYYLVSCSRSIPDYWRDIVRSTSIKSSASQSQSVPS